MDYGDNYMRKQVNSEDKLDFKPIGRAMREARVNERGTQEEVAEKWGIEQPYYQRLERYGQYPGINLFYKIVRLFQISVDEYFFPSVKPTKSTKRRRLDVMLDKLEDDELYVVEGTVKGLFRMRENDK